MKNLFWIGTIVLILGIASFFVPVPHTERQGVKAGDISFGIETRHTETLPPLASGIMVLGGAGMMIAARKSSGR
jgi:hypothetical protein